MNQHEGKAQLVRGLVTPDCVHSQIVGLLRGATGRVAGQLSISSLQLAESTCTSNIKYVLLAVQLVQRSSVQEGSLQ